MTARASALLAPLFAAALLVLASATPAAAEPAATVQSGDRVNYGRIVVDTSSPTGFHIRRNGDRFTVRLDSKAVLGSAPLPPRNVRSISTSGSSIELWIAPGARVQAFRQGGKIVLDIHDPVEASPTHHAADLIGTPAAPPQPAPALTADASAKSGPSPAPVMSATAAPASIATQPIRLPIAVAAATPLEPAAAAPTPVIAAPLSAPAPADAAPAPASPADPASTELADDDDDKPRPVSPGRDVAPEQPGAPPDLMVRRVRLPNDAPGSAILAPFAQTTGAAVFTDADGIDIVFDKRQPLDVTALSKDPVFGGATVRLLAAGTLLHLPPLPDRYTVLTPLIRGWRVAALPAEPRQQPVTFAVSAGKVSLAAETPNAVVSMADPSTGGTLLIGTQRRPGQGVMSPRRTAEFALLPSLMGVVVEPFSDHISLTPVATGFQLAGGPSGLFISPQTSMTNVLVDAAHLTRRYSFSTMPPEGLRALLRQQIDDAASAPPLARGVLNHRAAETMLALGMGTEAEGMLQLAAQQDPSEAASADNAGLTAIAALLAGRVGESQALTDRRLDGTDEIALWRAIRQATLDEGSPDAAKVFAETAPLAMVYPAALREHILPLILETMVQGGAIDAAKQLLDQRPGDPTLGYARALLLQAEGNVDGALASLDALANGRDQYNSARGAVRAVELRLAAHKLTRPQAADALDKLLYAWRGDRRELALRERVAELRAQTGQWTAALNTLRQAAKDFPNQADEIGTRLRETFAGMVHDPGSHRLKPLEFVSLVDENAELVHDTPLEDGVDRKLADDLLALDLPRRAEPVLRKLLANAGTDEARARYGLSLATLRDREGDPTGALQALDQYHGQKLPDDLTADRLLARASATAHKGDVAAAVALLAPVRSARATEARARLEEGAQDWPAAEQAWADCVALTVPGSGVLEDAQSRTVLRLATAMAHTRDEAAIDALRQRYANRIPPGPLADMFRLLTAAPVETTADIARSGTETDLAAALPVSLNALKADTAEP